MRGLIRAMHLLSQNVTRWVEAPSNLVYMRASIFQYSLFIRPMAYS